jgi:hypothetical protein
MTPDGRPAGSEPALTGVYLPGRSIRQLVGPAGERTRDVLPADWRLRLDPDNVGLAEDWPEHGLPADSAPTEVPGAWNTAVPGYAGVGWYEATFRPPVPGGGVCRLVVGAANYLTDAWLNGAYLGRHEGGYDAFSFRCGHALRSGENRLTLRIVDPPPAGEIDGLRLRECPTAKESWYGGAGGPWGGVWLEQTPHVWIEDVRVDGDLPGERATFRVTLASDLSTATSVDILARVRGPGDAGSPLDATGSPALGEAGTTVAVGPAGAVVTLTVPVRAPRPWSPESPTLYGLDIAITPSALHLPLTHGGAPPFGPPRVAWGRGPGGTRSGFEEAPGGCPDADVAGGTLGFRTCELRDGRFHLNGEPRYLKGGLLQPTFPRTVLRPPDALGARDVHLARAAGLNLIRFHLRPPPLTFLEQCDRLGIMAYVEPPLGWIERSGRLLEHGRRELAAMVRACGNHPSVVLWGIFNENSRAAEAAGGELLAELARLDPTRPIVENSGGAAIGEVDMWAWGGQSRCWSPGWEAPRPLNDVHAYLASPLRRDAQRLLTTLGDGPTVDVTPSRPAAERIESRLSAGAVLVSEYGCGALPDFDAALAASGAEADLADAALLRELRDALARGLAERGLGGEIGDVATLVRQTQGLQAEGLLAQTAALRRNPNVAGVIVTQLADAGWEQMAGLAGLWRHPRPALASLARAIRARLLYVEPDAPCSAGRVRVRAWLIQDPGLSPPAERGTLTLSAPASKSGPEAVRRRRVSLGGGTTDLGAFALTLPAAPGRYELRARLAAGAWVDEAACTVRRLPTRPAASGEGLVVLGRGLRGALPSARRELPPAWSGPILADLTDRTAHAELGRAVERARAGAHLCLLGLEPPLAERIGGLLQLPVRLHGARGNFMGMHHYLRDHPLFAELGAPCLAGAELAEVLPAWALAKLAGARALAGCFAVPDGGRGFCWRATVQTLPFGRGRLTVWQLRVGPRRGGGLGRHLLDALVDWMLGGAQ